MNEATLFAAHARGLSPDGPLPRSVTSAGPRAERCACGGVIPVEVQSQDAIVGAILVHQQTPRHHLWWTSASRQGWGL